MTTLMEQLMREHQPVVNPQIPPQAIVNNEARRDAIGNNGGRQYGGNNYAYREGGGDNFAEDYEFQPPRGLKYVKMQMPQFAGRAFVDDYLD